MKKTGAFAVALAVAVATSSAAIAAPKDAATGIYKPGGYFNCLIPTPGPKGFREGGCWLDGAIAP